MKPPDFTDGGFPVLHKGTIRAGGKLVFDRNGKAHTSQEYADSRPNSLVDSNFVVVTLRNLVRSGETLGYMARVRGSNKYLLAQGAYGIRLKEDRVHPGYLTHLSNTPIFRRMIKRVTVGSTQVHVRNKEFLSLEIPLPPLSEQKRIAGILDKADAIRRKRQQAIGLTEQFLRATFLDMFGDPVINPKGWPIRTLADVVAEGTSVSYGIVQCGPPVNDGVPYIKTSEMSDEILPPLEKFSRTAPEIAAKFQRSAVRTGDLVFANRATIGAVVMVPEYLDGANLTQGTSRISPGPDVMGDYLLWLIRSQRMQAWFDKWAKGATFREITMTQLRLAPVPVPDMKLQKRFGKIAAQFGHTLDELQRAIDEGDNLFNSLVQRAFSGDITMSESQVSDDRYLKIFRPNR